MGPCHAGSAILQLFNGTNKIRVPATASGCAGRGHRTWLGLRAKAPPCKAIHNKGKHLPVLATGLSESKDRRLPDTQVAWPQQAVSLLLQHFSCFKKEASPGSYPPASLLLVSGCPHCRRKFPASSQRAGPHQVMKTHSTKPSLPQSSHNPNERHGQEGKLRQRARQMACLWSCRTTARQGTTNVLNSHSAAAASIVGGNKSELP